MTTPNLYWPVYKNLEKEFLELANYVHISDDQIDIYSMRIADLIVRCGVEIESLAKELYGILGGNMVPKDREGNVRDLYFDTDCLGLLEREWHVGKKEITVSAITVYLAKEENRVLTPLHKAFKRGTSGSKWKQAYQAVKHDRRNSLKKATIRNLLYAMGALYILNLYYKDERIDIGRVYLSDNDFDNRVGSEIFSAHCCRATCIAMRHEVDDSCIVSPLEEELDRSIFIIKYDDESFREMHRDFCLDYQIREQRFNESPEIAAFLSEHPEYNGKSMNEICLAAGGASLFKKIVCMEHIRKNKSTRTEALLNKHAGIYPKLVSTTGEEDYT